MAIDVGESVPDFSLSDQDGNQFGNDSLAGRKAVLFFYPRAMTPGCTVEACDFRDNYAAFEDAGYQVVGVSPDPPSRNAKFRDKEGLTFPLLSDEEHSLAEALGAWGVKKNYGKEYEGLIRSTFAIDEGGKLSQAFRNVRAKGHVARVAQELGI